MVFGGLHPKTYCYHRPRKHEYQMKRFEELTGLEERIGSSSAEILLSFNCEAEST